MAFIGSSAFTLRGANVKNTTDRMVCRTCVMSIDGLGRREFLQVAGWAVAGGAVQSVFAYDKLPQTAPGPAPPPKVAAPVPEKLESLKELEDQVEQLKYEDELYLTPDPAEGQKYRIKKPEAEQEYEKDKKELEDKERKALEEERKEEAEENAKILELFHKK